MSTPTFLQDSYTKLRQAIELPEDNPTKSHQTLPHISSLENARSSLPSPASASFLKSASKEATMAHILQDLVPALNGQALSSRYFGFVTGGVLPVAEAADNVVSAMDQNVQVHLPSESIATDVETAALKMLTVLLGLEAPYEDKWLGRTFTTGATASNVLGLACGREFVLSKRAGVSIGQVGLLAACRMAKIEEIQVLTSAGHSSLAKAASLVGLGRDSVKELGLSETEPWRLDIDAVEKEIARPGVASIIAVSAGEVNTGNVAIRGLSDMARLRSLADQYDAWIHVDGGKGRQTAYRPWIDEFRSIRYLRPSSP